MITIIPLIINILFKYNFNIPIIQSEWSAGEALNFYGSILTLIGTLTLGFISIRQSEKANDISKMLLKKEMISTNIILKMPNKFDIETK